MGTAPNDAITSLFWMLPPHQSTGAEQEPLNNASYAQPCISSCRSPLLPIWAQLHSCLAKASAAPELSKTCLGCPSSREIPTFLLFIANPITFATTTIFDTSSLFTSTQLSRPLILSRIYFYSLYSDQRNHVCHRQRRVSLFLYDLATPPNPIQC